MLIQNVSTNQRTSMFSAPVRVSLGSSVVSDHQRISTSGTPYRRALSHNLSPIHSTVSVYDISILMPVSKKLADDYKLELNNLSNMCEINQELTEEMAKDELAHCWRLLSTLLSLQPSLSSDHSWFQSPIAQGKMNYFINFNLNDFFF